MLYGSIDPWSDSFPSGLVPEILDLIANAWPKLIHSEMNEHETSITRRLRAVLRQDRNVRRLPVSIERETLIDDASAVEKGRLDLKFMHGHNEDVYLVFEGKRLNVTGGKGQVHRRTSEYVAEGMARFVNRQYAVGLDQGGMLGYVMDGDVGGARKALSAAIREKKAELLLTTPEDLRPSPHRPADPGAGATCHLLPSGEFTLHHLLLACS